MTSDDSAKGEIANTLRNFADGIESGKIIVKNFGILRDVVKDTSNDGWAIFKCGNGLTMTIQYLIDLK